MKILAIDTSTKMLSIAILEGDKIISNFHEENSMRHSSMLMPTIDKLLKNNKLKLKNINVIALSVGPGSFTGLRIGVSTVKGINLGLGIPIVAVPTLDVIAHNFTDETESALCPIIDAKKNKVYSSIYHVHLGGLTRASRDMLMGVDELIEKIKSQTLIFGDGALLYWDVLKRNKFIKLSRKDWLPKAETVAKIGLKEARKKHFVNPDKLVPTYLHSKYCQVKGYKK